jgi:hypothetical protein
MDAVWEPTNPERGPGLLLEHCAALERLGHTRPPARDRLSRVLGYELAGLLLRALAGNHRGRSRRPDA